MDRSPAAMAIPPGTPPGGGSGSPSAPAALEAPREGTWITDWTTRANCKGTDPDELFVQGAAQIAPSCCAGDARFARSALRMRSTTELSSVCGAG